MIAPRGKIDPVRFCVTITMYRKNQHTFQNFSKLFKMLEKYALYNNYPEEHSSDVSFCVNTNVLACICNVEHCSEYQKASWQ